MAAKATKSARLLAVVVLATFVFGVALPAQSTQLGACSFAMRMVWPDYPCGGAACSVSSLSGHLVGALVRTGPNGVTACVPSCQLSEGPAGLYYNEPPCVAGAPLQGTASGQIRVDGGVAAGASSTPLDLNIAYVRQGVHTIITFTGGQTGLAIGVIRFISGVDCVSGNGPATVQIIGAGWFED